MGSSNDFGKVSIKPQIGRHLGNGKKVHLPLYDVMLDDRQVAIRHKNFNSPIKFTVKLPEDVKVHILEEVNDLLGESSLLGHMSGTWDHELTNQDDNTDEGDLDEIFN